MKKKIYEDILQLIEDAKDSHRNLDDITQESKHYFIQGLEVAQHIITQEQNWVYRDYAYEKLDEVIASFIAHSNLESDQMREVFDSYVLPNDD